MGRMERCTPQELLEQLAAENIRRFCLVWDPKERRVHASHPAVEPLARWMQADERDFDAHEGFFVQVGPETGLLMTASVHRTCRGQAAGGVRRWRYETVEDVLRDGLRLARGMTHKNALAGLWWGGGKGGIVDNDNVAETDPVLRRRIYEEYGAFMTSLRGCYVTAEDVGTCVEDMAAVFSRTRFTTCIPPSLGGSGNPSVPTARGVVRGMQAALAHLGMGDLRDKTVAVQGLGHVGEPLIRFLFEHGVARVIGSDVDVGRVEAAQTTFGEAMHARRVDLGDPTILFEDVDIVAPCATGGILSKETIPQIRAKIVCGAANNQLEDPATDDARFAEAGVLYVPDFLVNRMGIVNCADEQDGSIDADPNFEKHLGTDWDNSIYNLALSVFAEANQTGRTVARVAFDLAEERSLQMHPLAGHRGAKIIKSLFEGGWAAKHDQ